MNDCMVCLDTKPLTEFYKIECGSTVEHYVCDQCEIDMRMKEKPIVNRKQVGRFIKCPLCRVTETQYGSRSHESWKRETEHLYKMANRSRTAKKIRELEDVIVQAETALRYMQEEHTAMQEENHHLRNLCGLIVPEISPELSRVLEPLHEIARESAKSWCASGRRETRECTTRGKTSRKCSFPTCQKRVCRSCRLCMGH